MLDSGLAKVKLYVILAMINSLNMQFTNNFSRTQPREVTVKQFSDK